MPAKHFVNDPTHLVSQALRSLSITNPSVSIDAENKIVFAKSRGDQTQSTVSIISGGGSGHEPSFGGFVGSGLLAAAVAGNIFASPSTKQVLAAIERVDSSKGILVTVMNYTGDIMQFGMAVEKAKARNSKLRVEMLVVGDDVGVPRSKAGKVGRRGIAGTVLVHKVTGAMSVAGYELEDVVRVGRLVSENLVSVGVSLDRVHVPGRPKEEDKEHALGGEEVELGMGIHNEPGSGRKIGQAAELPALVETMLQQLLDVNDEERAFLKQRADQMVLLVNNLGALSVLELGAAVAEVTDQLYKSYSIVPARVYAGTYMTSLDGPGFSVTLMNVVDTGIDKSVLQLLDEPSEAAGWTAPVKADTWTTQWKEDAKDASSSELVAEENFGDLSFDLDSGLKKLKSGLKAMIATEPEVTKFDTVVGDGDCGTTLKRGAEAVIAALSAKPPSDVICLLSTIAATAEDSMDGTSGALYCIFLNALTQSFKIQSQTCKIVDVKFWSKALTHASDALAKYTPAQAGDRTVIDALAPFIQTLHRTGSVAEAASAGKAGAERTKDLKARLGRSVYVGNEDDWVGKIPDPGAWGLSKFFGGIASP